ncbi:MAG: hypothetical protein E7592_02735 [Ruminococcaceae bacterium]|nr:hypothetical protein [Oscillospiraceae bacterium]
MKKRILALIALLLVAVMTAGMLASCKNPGGGEETTTQNSGNNTEETTNKNEETTIGNGEDTSTGEDTTAGDGEDTTTGDGEDTTIGDGEDTTTGDGEDTTVAPDVKLEGEHADLIENAHSLKNGVTSYFSDASREHYRVENNNMTLSYPLTSIEDQLVSITNKKGNAYVTDTMDVYVTMENGKTYYSSGSFYSAEANIFRYGYYYYDIRLYGQDFASNTTITEVKDVSLKLFNKAIDMSKPDPSDGTLKTTITSTLDPNFYTEVGKFKISTSKVNALQITMKVTSTTSVDVFFAAGEHNGYTADQQVTFYTTNDGEYHTYTVRLDQATVKDFTGDIKGLRLDPNGSVGEEIEISSIKLVNIDDDGAPKILLDRNLHTYTDKLHQINRLIATEDVTGIKEIGMITKVAADTVDKLVVYDKNGLHYDLNDIDWASAEYVGFDIKDAGIFGYILAKDETSGTLTVTLEDGNYVIKQATVPAGGKLDAHNTVYTQQDVSGFKGTSTDIYSSETDYFFGQRIYTDASHDFAAFLKEADIERNPLTKDNIIINTDKTANATFDGYDGLRGIYAFTVAENVGFGDAYSSKQNFHGSVSFSVTGDDRDRNIYVLAYTYSTSIECGAVLNGKDMMLPIPVEVSKNFSNEFEEPIWAWGDIKYSEVRFPMVVKKGETQELTVLQLYMNWGKYPLKQISSIQFFAPYYHLSTGVTESNCISNYYVYGKDLQTLPDHRAASAPLWTGDPQHDNGGFHCFLQYTDKDGNIVASDSIVNNIESAGPTYADIDLTYRSDDGKIEVTYTHMEMPQLDENRAYYTMKYIVKEDVTIDEFYKNFSFYSVRAYGDGYSKLGYWGTNGAVADVDTKTTGTKYVLGTDCPYFDMYATSNTPGTQMADVSFLIFNSFVDLDADGKDDGVNFAVYEKEGLGALTLNIDGTQTIKAGATITINSIIMPWWNQAYRNGDTSVAPDQNVRDVRENSLLDPFKATAVENATVLDSEFLPSIKTTNGKDATFTLSGGENNVTFRVYGFKKLTAPKLYELVDGEWVLVDVSSATTADKVGNAHLYDGYAVHYDGNGTFSYSFVTTLTGDQTRTFKVDASEDFTGWVAPEIPDDTPDIENYWSASDISVITGSTLEEDNTCVRIYGDGAKTEKYFMLPVTSETTGGYVVIKYRVPTTNDTDFDHFQVLIGTQPAANIGNKDWMLTRDVKKDGQWHVMVIDLKEFNIANFVANDDGSYPTEYFRFDIFNVAKEGDAPMSATSYVDLQYIAICDSLEAALKLNEDMVSVDLVQNESSSTKIYVSTGTSEASDADYFNIFVDASTIASSTKASKGVTATLAADETYVTIGTETTTPEACLNVYTGGLEVTGQYIVIKYRIAAEHADLISDKLHMECFTSTQNDAAKGGDQINTLDKQLLEADGEWHVIIFDASALATFTPDANGKYAAKYIRLDALNQEEKAGGVPAGLAIDVAFVAMCEDTSAYLESLNTAE